MALSQATQDPKAAAFNIKSLKPRSSAHVQGQVNVSHVCSVPFFDLRIYFSQALCFFFQ